MVNTSGATPYSLDFFQTIKNVHWGGSVYLLVQINDTNNTSTITPPAPITTSAKTFKNRSKLVYRARPQIIRVSDPGLTYFVYVSPQQAYLHWHSGVPTDTGARAGYESFDEFYAAWLQRNDTGAPHVYGSQAQGIPPDGPFPGSSDPMTPAAEAPALRDYANSLPPGPDLGEGFPYTTLQNVVGTRSQPHSSTSTATSFLFEINGASPSPACACTVSGSWGDPSLGSRGIVVARVFSGQKAGLKNENQLVYPEDKLIQSQSPTPPMAFSFTVTRPSSGGLYSVSAAGLS